ncbi:MAG: heparinase II/III family protein [Acidobacteria bacterium]|nr:heparinase II/III family protein [Acidobacteriota bacterium]
MKQVWALCLLAAVTARAEKRTSAFYPAEVRQKAALNAQRYEWAAELRRKAVADAGRWVRMSDDELWKDVFGPRITRSHMVWSSGHCPACRKPVPMYDWQMDGWARPWKVRCPHCNELFPKNDFAAYHRSGLDEKGIFEPSRADRSLLYNLEHPDKADPLHRFGVDDGEGYVEGDKRWRFIGAYLLYGQWTQRIETGFRNLAVAYAVTGERIYAHKAAVLLDRVADVWPSFDFAAQGLVYERARYGGGVAGYVWYAINSAYTAMHLATAYDQIFDGIRDDTELVEFLRRKDARKSNIAAIRSNIETNIFRHVLEHPYQIRTNYPGQERAVLLIQTVLDWPGNRDQMRKDVDALVRRAVAVDGLSGEKGLAGYDSIAPREMAEVLEEYSRLDAGLLQFILERNPKLRQTYRFHFDTWINHEYYPHSGDAGSFTKKAPKYAGLVFSGPEFELLGRLARATGDPLYWQTAWIGNGQKVDGLPHDLFAEDPEAYAAAVREAVSKYGTWPKVESTNKEEWRIAVLRHRTAPDAAVWLDYDSVPECDLKSHYHYDAMNLGLYAKGLDLLPEFGYPAVQFGDWHTPQARWHKRTAAHNTVVVDGKDQAGGPTQCTMWSAGGPVQTIRASSPAQIGGKAYERTIALVETGAADFYVLDIFQVAGGREHAKHTHSAFGTAATFGYAPKPSASPYDADTLMRAFQTDGRPEPVWGVDWKIEDRNRYLTLGREVHLRYTDLTRGAEAMLAESWTVESATSPQEFWIPTVVARRRGDSGELESTFVSVMEPYEGQPRLAEILRVDREGDEVVQVEIVLRTGERDLLTSSASGLKWERRDSGGRVVFTGAANGR